jgi:RNA polymerase sigma-70 factor, ECF subfamily
MDALHWLIEGEPLFFGVGEATAMTDVTNPLANDKGQDFVQRLTGAQSQIYACICALLGGTQDARDVLQETNLMLWFKAAEYDSTRDFLAWAYTFARFQVMAYLKRASRNRMVFNKDLLDRIATTVTERNVDLQDRLRVLDDCIKKLSDRHRALLHRRYHEGIALNVIAAERGKTSTALGALLHRIRLALARCIHQQAIRSPEVS